MDVEWFYQQTTGLMQLGHSLQAVLPANGPLADRLSAAGIGVEVIPFQGRQLRQQPRVLAAELRLARFIRSFRPDVVHAHLLKAVLSSRLATLGYARALRVTQMPGMVHLHSWPFRQLDRWTLARDDLTIGSCRAIAERYRALGARATAVSYYGFDVHQFDPRTSGSAFRREFGLTDSTPTVGMVAYMYPTRLRAFREIGVKGHETFLDAARLIADKMPDVRIFVVGDEPGGTSGYRRRLEAKAASLGLSPVIHFTGYRADVASVIAGLDVVASPSTEDSACGAVIEALLMRRGVVASAVGGLPDTVQDGVSGILVPPRDPDALATGVLELLADPARRLEMANNGRKHCLRQYDIKATVAGLEMLYRESLGGVARRR